MKRSTGGVVCVSAAVALLMVAGADALATRSRGVLTGAAVDWGASRTPQALVWSRGDQVKYWRSNAYIRVSGHKKRINPAGSKGVAGGIDGNRVLYEEYHGRGDNLRLYNIDTGRRTNLPRGANSRDEERLSTLSGRWLLFTREHYTRRYGDYRHDINSVVLYNLKTHRSKTLARARNLNVAASGQVNGNWADWYTCKPRCRVFRYNISAKRITSRRPDHPIGYAMSISKTGVMYLATSGYGCGAHVRIEKLSMTGGFHTLFRVGKGFDTVRTFTYTKSGGGNEVVYDKVRCSNHGSDVFTFSD